MIPLVFDCGNIVDGNQSRLLVLDAPLRSPGTLTRPGHVLPLCYRVRAAILLNGCTIGLVGSEMYIWCIYRAVFCRGKVLNLFSGVACLWAEIYKERKG